MLTFVLNLGFIAAKINQVSDSIAWVRCAFVPLAIFSFISLREVWEGLYGEDLLKELWNGWIAAMVEYSKRCILHHETTKKTDHAAFERILKGF